MDDDEERREKELEQGEPGLGLKEHMREEKKKTVLRKMILAAMEVQNQRKKELQRFQEYFLEHYQEKITESMLSLQKCGINHFIFYDSDKFLIVKTVDEYNPKTGSSRVSLETEKFFYYGPADIKEVLERKYLSETKDIFGFKRAFVFEEPENLDSDKIMSDHYGNVYLPIDQAAMVPGFIKMRLGDPMGLTVSDDKSEISLEGRILEITCRKDKNKKPC